MHIVTLDKLQPGMILARSLFNDDLVVVLSAGTVLTNAHLIRLRFLNVDQVFIRDEADRRAEEAKEDFPAYKKKLIFQQNYEDAKKEVREVFEEISKGPIQPETVDKSRYVVRHEIVPMSKNSAAVDYLYEMKNLDDDIYTHSIRVSIIAGLIAKWMYMSPKVMREIVLAAFLHDIGKTKFDSRLRGKKVENLKGEDLARYQRHPQDGYGLLMKSPDLSTDVKLAVLQHHERMDGSGFPNHRKANTIHLYARIICIADIYDNITSERQGYIKQTPFAAIERFKQEMYHGLDPNICVPILTRIRDSLLGSTVLLNTGQIGRITYFAKDILAKPLIELEGIPAGYETTIDLNQHSELQIVEYNPV